MEQSHSIRTKRKAIAIINCNHVLIRPLPSLRRMEFSEATPVLDLTNRPFQALAVLINGTGAMAGSDYFRGNVGGAVSALGVRLVACARKLRPGLGPNHCENYTIVRTINGSL